MNEKALKKRMTRVTIVMSIISAAILLLGYFFTVSLQNVQQKTQNAQMYANLGEYKSGIERRFRSNLELLNSLASFLEYNSGFNETEFMESLNKANMQSSFTRMGYYGVDGNSMRVMINQKNEKEGTRIFTEGISGLEEEAQRVVKEAWRGKETISDIFYDEQLEQKTIVFVVPVYHNGEIIGALGGADTLKPYHDVLDVSDYLGYPENVNLIDRSGNLLVRSQKRLVKGELNNIFTGDLYSDQEILQIRQSMSQKETFVSELMYEGDNYSSLYMPMNGKDWYIVYVDDEGLLSDSSEFLLRVTQGTFAIVLFLVIGTMFYIYRQLRKGNENLIRLAYYDNLTGAFNIIKLLEKMDERRDIQEAVAILNVHQFQYINRIFGHEVSDQLLCYISDVIRKNLNPGEYYCRENADQFILTMNESRESVILRRLSKIMDEVGEFAKQYGKSYQVMMYAGVVLEKNKYEQGKYMIHHAEFALKEAKKHKENKIVFFNDRIQAISNMRVYVEGQKLSALENGEFQVYLQPKKNLQTEELVSAEALVRWIRADGSMILPAQFIPVFEENGFCVQLDLYMFEQVCKKIRHWIDAGKEPSRISVNQSKLLFYKDDYVEQLCEITDRYRVPREYLTLEILESMAAENIKELNVIIDKLHEQGFRVSMDDFGSGYSSLNILGNLKIDEVKLDRIFLMASSDYAKMRTIMKHIVQLAKEMGITTVVEGVETRSNELFIKDILADYGQGYYYSKPISVEQFEELFMS